MHRVILGKNASPIGFGCVQLTAHSTESEAVAILERAFSLGITHFDVARGYGFGRAEGILGKFLRGRRHQVTIATKFGLQPPSGLAGNARLINTAKRLLRPFPALMRRAKHHGSTLGKSGAFDPETAVRSVETSLRELGTDYIDLLLLHEASLLDAESQPLLEALDRLKAKGAVRHVGIGSEFSKLNGAGSFSAAYEVAQFADNACSRNLATLEHREERLAITHSVFVPARRLQEAVAARRELVEEYSRLISADLSDLCVVASLLWSYALRGNREGIVLFSTTNQRHLEANAREAASHRFDEEQVRRFVEFVDKLLNAPCSAALPPAREIA
jgi:D-threo-aldose 1-dehydrogenase